MFQTPRNEKYDFEFSSVIPCLQASCPEFEKNITPGKNNLFRKSNARTNELRHENGCIKSSSQLRGEHCKSSSDFFPSECPGLCRT